MAITFLFLVVATLSAAEPKRAAGLSVHMLPDRVAKIGGGHGGFTVSDPTGANDGKTYADPKELFAYFQHLSANLQENGIWVVTTDPSSYSEGERGRLKTLIALCAEKSAPIYTCRGMDLPNGWKLAK